MVTVIIFNLLKNSREKTATNKKIKGVNLSSI